MKHNLKADGQPSLDQYFDAARNEPPLMEDDAFASIIDKADAAPTEIMKQSPTSRIMTAIRQQQGGMIMTGLGLTALTGLLITGYYLSPAEPEQTTTLATAVNTPAASAIEATGTQLNAVAQDAASQVIHQVHKQVSSVSELAVSTDPKPAQFRHPLSLDSIWSRVKVESLNPIEITAQEIDELGVNDGGDGKVFLVHELNKGGVRMKMAFPPTGMDAAYDIRVGNAERNDDTELTPVMPTMVTDAKGKKLAFFFKSQTNSNSINIQSASMSQRDGFDGNDPGSNIPEVSMNIDIVNTDDAGAGNEIEIENELQEIFSTFPDIPAGSMQLEFDDSRIKIDSLMKRRGGLGAKMMVFDGSDSAFKGKFDFDFKLDRDSLDIDVSALMEQAKGMQQHALKIRINADSLRAEAMRMLKGFDLDSMHQNAESIRKQMLKRFRIDSTGGFLKQLDRLKDLPQLNHLQKLPGKKSFDLPIIQIDLEQINKLIPVKIRDIDPSVRYNQNGLIFWYARDEKFAEKAPESLRQKIGQIDQPKQLAVSSVSAISAPMIYPNPTAGRTTFKYSLSAPRAVSMAVHDLLGKQVMKVTNLETKAAGTFEKELDLSTLEPGVYLLIMVTDVGEQITQRVVIER